MLFVLFCLFSKISIFHYFPEQAAEQSEEQIIKTISRKQHKSMSDPVAVWFHSAVYGSYLVWASENDSDVRAKETSFLQSQSDSVIRLLVSHRKLNFYN